LDDEQRALIPPPLRGLTLHCIYKGLEAGPVVAMATALPGLSIGFVEEGERFKEKVSENQRERVFIIHFSPIFWRLVINESSFDCAFRSSRF